MEGVLKVIAATFMAVFAAIWLYVAGKLWSFDPTEETPKLVFSQEFAAVAGLVAAGVAAGTASVLGIEVQKTQSGANGGGGGGVTTLAGAVQASLFLKVGVLVYFFVGVINLGVWLGDTEVAPEMISAFALGVLGWMGGAFSAVFQSSSGGGGGGGGGGEV